MDPIYCKYCQTPLQEYASFCPGCGRETDSREAATSISEKIPTVLLTRSEDERTALSQKSLPHAQSAEQDNATYVIENLATSGLEYYSEHTPTTSLETMVPLAEQVDLEKDDEEDNGVLFIPGIPGPPAGAPLVNGVPQIGGAPSVPGTPQIGGSPALSGHPPAGGFPGHAPFANTPLTYPASHPGPAWPGNMPVTYTNPTPPSGGPGPAQPGGGPAQPAGGPAQPAGGPTKPGGKGCIPWVVGLSLLLVLIIVLLLLFPPFGSQPSAAQAQINILTSSLNSSNAYPGGTIMLHGQHFLPGGTVTFQENGQQVQAGGLVSSTTSMLQSLDTLVFAQTLTQQMRSFQTTTTVKADGTFDCSFTIPSTWPINSVHPVTATEHKDGKSTSARVNITVQSASITQVTGTPTATSTPTDTPTPTPTSTDTPTPAPTDTPVPPTVPPTQVPPPPPPTQPVTIQRQLSAQQTLSKTVPATGRGTTAGTQASGSLLIYNSNLRLTLTLSAGTVITNQNGCGPSGLQMVLNSTVSIAPSSGGSFPAHVATIGTAGNIPAQCTSVSGEVEPAFIYYHCPDVCDWDATSNEGAFSGGTDPQTYAVVQQSDIDGAAAALKPSTAQTATANIQGQLHTNEHLVATPQCSYKVSSDHNAGDIAGRLTVTVVATCTATAST